MKTRLIIIAATLTATILIAASCAAHSQRRTKQADNEWPESELSKLDAQGRLLADSLITGQKSGRAVIGVLVSMAEGANASSLADAGFKVTTDLGSSVLLSIPTDSLRKLASLPQVKAVSLGTTQTLYNTNTPAIQKNGASTAIIPMATPSKTE